MRWRFTCENANPSVEGLTHLQAAIRAGTRVNEAVHVAERTLAAITGPMAAHSGQDVT